MPHRIGLVLLACANALSLPAIADPLLSAAVLPASRSTQTGNTVTAFATIINGGTSAGESCGIALDSVLPITFSYQTTDSADNSLSGTANTPVDIAAGEAQSFVMSFEMTGTFESTDVELEFSCSNSGTAAVLPSINTILLTSSATATPDVVALAATLNNDGYSEIEGVDGTGIFAVSTSNIGDAGDLTVTADSGANGAGVNILLCETDATSGTCTNPTSPAASVSTTSPADSTLTFGVFVEGNGFDVADDPAVNRAFVRIESDDATAGLTSVALRTVNESEEQGSPFEAFGSNVTVIFDGDEVVLEATGRPDHTSCYWNPDNASGLYVDCDPDITETAQMSPGFIENYDNLFTLRVPLNPTLASSSSSTGLGAVGIATSGVPIFNDQEGPNRDLEIGVIRGFDRNGGHTGPQTYHYHLEPVAITNDDSALVGIIADGFFLYGRRCDSTGTYPDDLDVSGGHTSTTQHTGTLAGDEEYHYHIMNDLYLGGYYLLFPEDYQGTPSNIGG